MVRKLRRIMPRPLNIEDNVLCSNEKRLTVENDLLNIRPERLPMADILRGLAALWVFLFHIKEGKHIKKLEETIPNFIMESVFGAGHFGVAVFFVLSGLVIAQSASRCGASVSNAKYFLIRRIIRLCPPYYLSIVVALLFLFLKSEIKDSDFSVPRLTDIGFHLIFSQDIAGIKALNTVYWTLCIEVQFYFVFSILMLIIHYLTRYIKFKKAFILVMMSVCTISMMWPLRIIENPAWRVSFLPTWHLFLLGVLLSYALNRERTYLIIYLSFLAVQIAISLSVGEIFTLAGACASVILLAASRKHIEESTSGYHAFSALGLISYSFYLLHNHITGATFSVTRGIFGGSLSAEVAGIVASLTMCLIAAWFAYKYIEKPAISLGKKWGTRVKA